MKSYRIGRPMAASLSLAATFSIMAPIIAEDIKRAIIPPLGLFILDSVLFISFYILIYNTIRNLKARY